MLRLQTLGANTASLAPLTFGSSTSRFHLFGDRARLKLGGSIKGFNVDWGSSRCPFSESKVQRCGGNRGPPRKPKANALASGASSHHKCRSLLMTGVVTLGQSSSQPYSPHKALHMTCKRVDPLLEYVATLRCAAGPEVPVYGVLVADPM